MERSTAKTPSIDQPLADPGLEPEPVPAPEPDYDDAALETLGISSELALAVST